jgi:hypothetical protein
MTARPLSQIAREIRTSMMDQASKAKTRGPHSNWRNKFYAAVPYLDAMLQLQSLRDTYGSENAHSIVSYFLCNVSNWQGPEARRLKAELRAMIG